MKNIFYLMLSLLLFNCGPDESTPLEPATLITDQNLTIESHLFGDVYTQSYDDDLVIEVTNDSLFVESDDLNFNMVLAIDGLVNGIVAPSSLRFPNQISSGPSGQLSDCMYYPCENYNITFTEMDFNQFGILEGSIYGAHETNPEEVQVYGSFKLQVE